MQPCLRCAVYCLNLLRSIFNSVSLSHRLSPSSQCIHTFATRVPREVSNALQTLGFSWKCEDDMLETIRSEVKHRGTQKAITSEIIEADLNDATDYVISRPRKALTTRDYLNDKHTM